MVILGVDDQVQHEIDAIDAKLGSLDEDDWQTEYMLEMKRSELIRRNGKMLNFGTKFDFGGSEAALRHYEEKARKGALSPEDEEAQKNRGLLYDVMIRAGFEPYADEWWHFNDPASQMGAKVAGREYAEYGAIEMSYKNKQYEQMRKQHHLNSVRLAQGEEWIPPQGLREHYQLARAAIVDNNPQSIWNMRDTIAKIEPPKHDIAA